MRVFISSFLIFMFLLNLSCTSINVRVEYNRGAKDPKTVDPSTVLLNVPALPKDSLSQLHPCRLKNNGDQCPPEVKIKEFSPCNAPGPDKTPAIAQKTTSWCWAASSETVLTAHNRPAPKGQCERVNQVLNHGNCCVEENDQPPGPCQVNGWPYEVFNKNGIDWEWVEGPLSESTIAGQLCRNGPFIFVLKLEDDVYHTFVVKGIDWMPNGDLFLLVHDHSWLGDFPLGGGPPTEFQKWPYRAFKEGYWLDEGPYENVFSFVAIRPR